MFLKMDYRRRAMGLLGALAVLVTGIVLNQASAEPLPSHPPVMTMLGLPESRVSDDCMASLHDRSDNLCYIC
jgi:hypothetical protein